VSQRSFAHLGREPQRLQHVSAIQGRRLDGRKPPPCFSEPTTCSPVGTRAGGFPSGAAALFNSSSCHDLNDAAHVGQQALLGDLAEIHAETARADLLLSLHEKHAALQGAFEYNVNLFEAETIGRMALELEEVLDVMAADQDRPVCDLSFSL